MRGNVLDLATLRRIDPDAFEETAHPEIGSTPWKLVLLLSMKDRADEVVLGRREGRLRFSQKLDGAWYELVPPPEFLLPAMIEEVRDLCRAKGVRAWLIWCLRALIRRLEGPCGPDPAYFLARLEPDFVRVSVER